MAAPPEQADVAAFLQGLAGGAPPAETHISLVFIGKDTVWKLKKAVRLTFLDFTPLAAREHFIRRELELNQPAAPELYRDVVPVVRRCDGSLAMDEPGEVVDWVLRMARVPPDDFMEAVADTGRLDPAMLDALGDAVAAYHRTIPAAPNVDALAAMRQVTEGNARSALDAGLPEPQVRAWEARVLTGLDAIAGWLRQREHDGCVRRAHGDLHLGNLCLWHGRPVPFDALEFDEAMATIDLGYDLAFLLMDLDQRVDRTAANRVLNRYVARTGDAALTEALPVFLSLRAMIRAHVEAKRGNSETADRYLAAAANYLRRTPPIVLTIGGLPGTGKSTLARALAPELGNSPGALVLRSDEIRKRQYGVAPEQRLPQAAYRDAASEAVLAELARLAGLTAAGGHAVIADATFIDPRHRSMLEAAATAAGVRFVGLWLQAPLVELEARIIARQGDASDATLAVLHATASGNPEAGGWMPVDATSPGKAVAAARAAIHQHVMRNGPQPC